MACDIISKNAVELVPHLGKVLDMAHKITQCHWWQRRKIRKQLSTAIDAAIKHERQSVEPICLMTAMDTSSKPPKVNLKIEVDYWNDIVIINGMRYAGSIFRAWAEQGFPVYTSFTIVNRKDGTLEIQKSLQIIGNN